MPLRSLLAALFLFWLVAPRSAEARARPGVVLHISVAGARVLVDGDEAESAASQEFTLHLRPGSHKLRIEHDGFQPWEQSVEVGKGSPERVEVLLKVEAPPPPPPAPPKAPEAPVVKAEASSPPPATPPAPKIARPIRVGVYEVKAGPGVDARMSSIVSDALLAEVRKLDRVSAISMEEIGEMLSFEQKRQLLGCDQDACLAEIAGAMGVDEIVASDVSTLGGSRLFTIRRLDMAHASVKGSVTKRLQVGNGEEMLAAIGPGIEELYPEYPLREGRVRGVAKAVAARLNPPPLHRAVFFSTAGAAVAATLVGGVFALQFQDAQSQHDQLAQRSLSEVVAASDLQSAGKKAVTQAQHANIAFGVAAGLAVTAGVMAFFTDWHGYASSTSELHSSDAKVSWQLTPTGMMVSWR